MITEPFVEVRCAVCAGDRYELICSSREIRAHLEYLRRFHLRRLRSGEGVHLHALADRAEFTQDYATDIVACADCGLLFRNPRPPASSVADAYARDEYGEQRLRALFDAQRELFNRKARRLARWFPIARDLRVVEVGSFVGGFLAAAGKRGWQAIGVDPGEEVTEFSRRQGLDVFRGTLAGAPIRPRSVDCVAVWNTFDQLPNPEPTIAAARRLLRPGGILALRVPNGDCFRLAVGWLKGHRLPRLLGGWVRAALAWNNLLAFPYLHGYSVRTLDWLLAWHGLRRIAVHGDTLARLADAKTRPWASWEERMIKMACRAAASLGGVASGRAPLAPWIDVYYCVASA